jgi:hypothetical protein
MKPITRAEQPDKRFSELPDNPKKIIRDPGTTSYTGLVERRVRNCKKEIKNWPRIVNSS